MLSKRSGTQPRVVIVGGAGDMAGVAARRLLEIRDDVALALADRDETGAARRAAQLGQERVSSAGLDLNDGRGLRTAMRGAALVVNATGPYFRTGPPVLEACIDERVSYIDFGDDLEAADVMLGLDRSARDAGVTALIGAGIAPGAVNVAVRKMADRLDVVERVRVAWVTGSSPRAEGELGGGRAVLEHMLHECLGITWTIRDGRRSPIPAFRVTEVLEFPPPLGFARVYDLGHAELATIPRAFPEVREVRSQGGLMPVALNGIFQGVADLVAHGSVSWDQAVDFLIALDSGERPAPRPLLGALRGVAAQGLRRELAPADISHFIALLGGREEGETPGGLRVEVEGRRDGRSLALLAAAGMSQSAAAGGMDEVTGTPLSVFADLLLDGRVAGPGVLAPEQAVDPGQFEQRIAPLRLPGIGDLFAPGEMQPLLHGNPPRSSPD